MKKEIIAIIILIFSINTYSQVSEHYKAQLEYAVREPNYGLLVELYIPEDYSFLKNIPDIKCDLSAINYFRLNQYMNNDSIQNQMYLFIGVDKTKREKYVVVDANNNHDFSDDKLYIFSIPEEPLTREQKRGKAVGLKITLDAGKNIFANIGVDPYNFYEYKYSLPQDEQLEVVIIFTDDMEAHIQIADTPVEIYADVSPNLFNKEINKRTSFYVVYKDKDEKPSNKDFQMGDTIRINERLLRLAHVEHPTIYFEQIGLVADSSTIDSAMPVVYAKDLESSNDILINDLIKNKYVFIDFWGSWCRPCVASIPKLQKLHEEIENREDVLMLGIASENKGDTETLNRIIINKDIRWLNLWVDLKDNKNIASIIQKLNILAYPTYVIIDNKGKIVYKERSEFKTEEATKFFLDLINR